MAITFKDDANRELELALRTEDSLIGRLAEEKARVGLEADWRSVERELFKCGRSDLVAHCHVCFSSEAWAQARCNKAAEGFIKEHADGFRTVAGPALEAEQAAACKILADARAATAVALRACIDE